MNGVDGILLLLWLIGAGAWWYEHQRGDQLENQVRLLLTPMIPTPTQGQERILARLHEIEKLLQSFVRTLDGMERDVAAALRTELGEKPE